MNYETIVLELLTRIKNLESRVSKIESGQKSSSQDTTVSLNKYSPLTKFLNDCQKDNVSLSFSEIEEILNFSLPKSAFEYRPFWANSETHSIALSWLTAGFKIVEVDLEKKIAIFRTTESITNEKRKKKSFYLGGKQFFLEIGYHDGRTFRLYMQENDNLVDYEGNQKRFIVAKLKELITENPNSNITEDEKNYIMNYGPGKTHGQNSSKLAKMLYRLLPENREDKNNENNLSNCLL